MEGHVHANGHGCGGVEVGDVLNEDVLTDVGLQSLAETAETFGWVEVVDEDAGLPESVDVVDDGGGLGDVVEGFAGLEVVVVGDEGVLESTTEVGEAGEGVVDGPVEGRSDEVRRGHGGLQVGGDLQNGEVVAEEEEEAEDFSEGAVLAGEVGRLGNGGCGEDGRGEEGWVRCDELRQSGVAGWCVLEEARRTAGLRRGRRRGRWRGGRHVRCGRGGTRAGDGWHGGERMKEVLGGEMEVEEMSFEKPGVMKQGARGESV